MDAKVDAKVDGRGDAKAEARAETALEAVIDAQRAEQRNAESLMSQLGELRDRLAARGDEARSRLDALDREIVAAAARVKQALRLQAELALRLGRGQGAH